MKIEINIANASTATITIDGKTATMHRNEGISESSPLGESTDNTFGGVIADNVVPLVTQIMEAMELHEMDNEGCGMWDPLTDDALDDLGGCFF